MIQWFSENLATIIVAAIVFAVLALVVVKMIRDKKRGKGGCSCGCGGCPHASACLSSSKPSQNR